MIAKNLVDMTLSKKKKNVKTQHIKDNLIIFVKALIVNPSFDSQSKETLTTPVAKFGSKCELSEKFYEKLFKSGIIDKALSITEFYDKKKLVKTDGKKISRRYMWSNFGDDSQTNYWCESEDRYFFHNAFSMFRTSYLKKYPFDEHYSGKEDRYWANNQIENGFDIYYDSEQEVKHHYTPGGATWMGTG